MKIFNLLASRITDSNRLDNEIDVYAKQVSHLLSVYVVASVFASSSSKVALNPNSAPIVNDDLSSSAVWVVLILLSFTDKFSCRINNLQSLEKI